LKSARIAAGEDRHLRTLFEVGAAGILPDGQLLERFATDRGGRSELAFAALVERHGPMVLRVARGVLRDEHASHDAFQATFLILARKGRSLWVRDSLGPWLHAVAWRVAMRSRSAEIRRRRHERAASAPEAFQARDRDRDDLARAIHEEIARLPEPFRAAVVTCHLEGLTQHDAARSLGWPVGTLQSRLDRGRRRLRERLGRRGLAPSLGNLAVGLPLARLPVALVAVTARAASTLTGGGPIAGMIGPSVLALIDASAKGMMMTKLKIAAATLFVTVGLIGSGHALGPGRHAGATEGPTPRPPAQALSVMEERAENGRVLVRTHRPPAQALSVMEERFRSADAEPADSGALQPGLGHPEAVSPPPLAIALPALPTPIAGERTPVLLDFHASWCGPCRTMRPEVEKLVRKNYPVQSIDIDRSPELAERYGVKAVPTFVVVDANRKALARTSGAMPAARLASFYDEAKARSAPAEATEGRDASAADLDVETVSSEPPLTEPVMPRPWETVVRIKIHLSDTEWGFGSGTVIHSTPEESIILTCAHIFRVKGQEQPRPRDFRVPISVDLFDGTFTSRLPATVRCSEKDVPGLAIDYDFTDDVGLIRIRPGRKLAASRVVPPYWHPERGMKMFAVGCSHGNDATAWDTKILDPKVTMTNTETHQPFSEIKCSNEPRQGRTGGGLYTQDGYVAGVCDFADPNEHVGLYAVPEAIHKLLDRNGLAKLYRGEEAGAAPATEAPIEKVRTRKRAAVGSRLPFEIDADPAPVEPEHRRPVSGLDADPAAVEPGPRRPVSDQERRLAEVERKLERVLRALEGLKGDAAPDDNPRQNVPPRGR